MEYIQAILTDGKKVRFVGGIPPEYHSKILHKKTLVGDELFKIPEVVDGKLNMRDETQEEIDAKNAKLEELNQAKLNDKLITLKTKIDAGKSLNIDVTDYENELTGLLGA